MSIIVDDPSHDLSHISQGSSIDAKVFGLYGVRNEVLGGSGGMPPQKIFKNLCCREAISFILGKHLLFLNHQVYHQKLCCP